MIYRLKHYLIRVACLLTAALLVGCIADYGAPYNRNVGYQNYGNGYPRNQGNNYNRQPYGYPQQNNGYGRPSNGYQSQGNGYGAPQNNGYRNYDNDDDGRRVEGRNRGRDRD